MKANNFLSASTLVSFILLLSCDSAKEGPTKKYEGWDKGHSWESRRIYNVMILSYSGSKVFEYDVYYKGKLIYLYKEINNEEITNISNKIKLTPYRRCVCMEYVQRKPTLANHEIVICSDPSKPDSVANYYWLALEESREPRVTEVDSVSFFRPEEIL